MDGDDWTAVNITQSDSISVTLTLQSCDHKYLLGLRYIWRESPCPYKKCAVYSVDNELPAPPLIYNGYMANMTNEMQQVHVFKSISYTTL